MKRILVVLAVCLAFKFGVARASVDYDVQTVFFNYVQAQNAKNDAAVSDILLNSPDFLSVTMTGVSLWGHDIAMDRFRGNWAGSWKLEPLTETLRVVEIAPGAALLNTRLILTAAPPGEKPRPISIKWTGVFTQTAQGWRISSIVQAPMP